MAVIEMSAANFEQDVLEASGRVLVDFYAEWCGPCKRMAPMLDELSSKYKDKIVCAKLNIDGAQSLAEKYEVMTIPTFIVFEHGEVREKSVGSRSKKELEELIEKNID